MTSSDLKGWMWWALFRHVSHVLIGFNKLCGRPPQYAPPSWPLTFWPWKWYTRVTCEAGCLCASFSLPRPLSSGLSPGVRDRRTDVRRASSLNAPYHRGWGITRAIPLVVVTQMADGRVIGSQPHAIPRISGGP